MDDGGSALHVSAVVLGGIVDSCRGIWQSFLAIWADDDHDEAMVFLHCMCRRWCSARGEDGLSLPKIRHYHHLGSNHYQVPACTPDRDLVTCQTSVSWTQTSLIPASLGPGRAGSRVSWRVVCGARRFAKADPHLNEKRGVAVRVSEGGGQYPLCRARCQKLTEC